MSHSTQPPCDFPNCGRKRKSKNNVYCNGHYMQLWRGEELRELKIRRDRKLDPFKLFWQHVDQTPECWIWTSGKTDRGYGRYSIDGKMKRAHRISYELAKGPIPPHLIVDHICRERACVNPEHLRLVTPKQNSENQSDRGHKGATSRFRGVMQGPTPGTWIATVRHHHKTFHIGTFRDEEEAATAASKARARLFTHSNEHSW